MVHREYVHRCRRLPLDLLCFGKMGSRRNNSGDAATAPPSEGAGLRRRNLHAHQNHRGRAHRGGAWELSRSVSRSPVPRPFEALLAV